MKKLYTLRSIVRKSEFKAIAGQRYRTIAYLTAILALTYLCIGFSNKALEYQRKLAADPLSNWINIEVMRTMVDSSVNLMTDLSDPAMKTRFLLKNIYMSKGFGAAFIDRNGNFSGLPLPRARTIDPRSAIIPDLLDSSNNVKPGVLGNVFKKEPFGFVVTRRFLEQMDFPYDSVKYLSYGLYGNTYVPVPVLGVVKTLPDNADVLCTDSFYILKQFIYPEDLKYSKLFIETTEKSGVEMLKTVLEREYKICEDSTIYDKSRGITLLCFLNSRNEVQDFFNNEVNAICKFPDLGKYHVGRYCQVVNDTSSETRNYYSKRKKSFAFDYIALEFSRLDHLQDFADYIKARYKVSVNMETVAQRQNFLFSLNISYGAIMLVLIISGFSIMIFLSNSLRNHLDKEKRNLGNFLAFGANRYVIIEIYSCVVIEILLISTAVALGFAFTIGELLDKYWLKKMLILEGSQDLFSLLNFWIVIYTLAIFIVAITKTFVTVWLLVRKSPGDLVYEREKRGV